MGKGASTRAGILDHAADLASRVGLGALSIGDLASDMGMSKSGLFAHFGSKETLQVQTLEAAANRFVREVVRPALEAESGEPRVQALFDRWLAWADQQRQTGCLFVQSTAEFDDQPGPVRDTLEHQQRQWLDFLAEAAARAMTEGHFRPDVDTQQFAFELHALLLGYHHAKRMMRDQAAEERLRTAFERLLGASRSAMTVRSK